MLKPEDIDKLIGKNLKRLRLNAGLTQEKLGGMVETDGVVIVQIEGAIRGMGKDIMMARIGHSLNVQPYEFYIGCRRNI